MAAPLSVKTVARLLGLSVTHLNRLIASNLVPVVRRGGRGPGNGALIAPEHIPAIRHSLEKRKRRATAPRAASASNLLAQYQKYSSEFAAWLAVHEPKFLSRNLKRLGEQQTVAALFGALYVYIEREAVGEHPLLRRSKPPFAQPPQGQKVQMPSCAHDEPPTQESDEPVE